MKELLLTFLIPFTISTAASAKPTSIYLLDISGNPELGEKLIAALSKKSCLTLQDVHPTKHGAGNETCHAFRKFQGEHELKKSRSVKVYRYKVAIADPEKFNLQIFERDGAKTRRILNAGDFKPTSDFFAELEKTTLELTFK